MYEKTTNKYDKLIEFHKTNPHFAIHVGANYGTFEVFTNSCIEGLGTQYATSENGLGFYKKGLKARGDTFSVCCAEDHFEYANVGYYKTHDYKVVTVAEFLELINQQPTTQHQTMENEKPSNEKPSNEKPSNEKPSNEKPSNEKEIVINLGKIDPIAIIKDAAETYVQKATDEFIKQNADARFEGSVKRYIAEQIESLRPTVVTTPTGGKVEVKGRTHKEFKKALFLACLEKQLFIAGPSGSGKTSLAEQVSKALELPFSFISCSAGLSEAHLLGRMLFDGTYISSEFVKLYENGGVFLFDEVDAADANTMLVINSALSNGVLSLPNRKESQYAKRHENFICICAGNTWGSGSFEYHGRNQLDVAFLDRFALSKLVVDYDRGLEKEMCAAHPDFASILWLLRDSVEKNRIRRVVSTRAFISGARQLSAGMTPKLLIDALMIGWSAEENKKVSADITNEIVALEAEMKKGKVGVKPVTA